MCGQKQKGGQKMKNAILLFISGMALAFDFTGIFGRAFLPQDAPQKAKTDSENIRMDWENVGMDIRKAMGNLEK